MADGELAAVFRGLANDAEHAGTTIAGSVAKNIEEAAAIEDGNITRSLEGEERTARSFADIADGRGAGSGIAGGPPGQLSGDPGEPAPGQAGGTIRPHVDDSIHSYYRNEKWADEAYDRIRGSDDVVTMAQHLRDAPRLDGSTGFSIVEIHSVKHHVFVAEHPLAGENGGVVSSRFESNADMAEAWLRLRKGTHQPADLTLLEHELAERGYWQQHPDAVYWDAHRAANQTANWEQNIPAPTYEDYDAPWE